MKRISSLSSYIFSIFLVCVVICLLLFQWYSKLDYTYKTDAIKVSEINSNNDRNIIGYTMTGYGERAVYDKPYDFEAYKTIYEYSYNGTEYMFELESTYKPENKVSIYVNEKTPSQWCLAKEKINFKEIFSPVR